MDTGASIGGCAVTGELEQDTKKPTQGPASSTAGVKAQTAALLYRRNLVANEHDPAVFSTTFRGVVAGDRHG